ncbi:DUF5710 domain-containing protein [Rhodococcoides kyotonense]|uniref:DUF5710 domain-containing protein n=1 Tax=Rhodococcoides kyotonense TaxID=398843 RepID=UPI000B797622|nr:DUF5710 domain-containing protein [Rhodococcus kyotonensis]
MVERLWLDVAYAEKDLAKEQGARWDPTAKRWYAPRAGIEELARWAARPEIPDVLPGEDRTLGDGLFVDLIPDTCWFTNVRSCVEPGDWERLRRTITRRAGMKCEICGAEADRHVDRWLEVHERWDYDWIARTQRLARLICLCTDCHRVTHYGFAQVTGKEREAFDHLVTVTGKTPAQARRHIDDAFVVWRRASGLVWDLDLDILTGVGISVRRPPSAVERREIAARSLDDDGSTPSRRDSGCEADEPQTPGRAIAASPRRNTKWYHRVTSWWTA